MRIRRLFFSIALVFISACSTTPTRNYLLDVTLPAKIPAGKTDKVLQVSMPQAAPGFDSPALIYVRTPHVLEHYSQNQWVDTPARMLLPLIVWMIEATGQFGAVLSATTPNLTGELRLDTEIVRLQQEFSTQPSQVRLVLRVQLLDLIVNQVVATRLFEIVEPAPTDDAAGGVLATHRAVAKVLEELAKFLIF